MALGPMKVQCRRMSDIFPVKVNHEWRSVFCSRDSKSKVMQLMLI